MEILLEKATNKAFFDFLNSGDISEYKVQGFNYTLNKIECDAIYNTLRTTEKAPGYVRRQITENVITEILCKKYHQNRESKGNLVFLNSTSKTPLSSSQIASICRIPSSFFEGKDSRLNGNMCHCNGSGEFVVDKETDGKTYIRCRICGEYSHL